MAEHYLASAYVYSENPAGAHCTFTNMTLILARISKNMHWNVWDEIT